MNNIKRVALASVACVAVAVPAIALAANPVKGGHYSNQKVLDFATVSKTGKSAKLDVFPGKCFVGIGVKATKSAKIAGGKLTYDGPAVSPVDKSTAITVIAKGKFVSSKALKWTVQVKSSTCTSKHSDTLTLMKKS